MAKIEDAFPENIDGLYFVDQECIACDTCAAIAPQHFVLTKSSSHAYVYTQPKSTEELRRCEKALSDCPVAAIGKRE